jgi:hypothetical protein
MLLDKAERDAQMRSPEAHHTRQLMGEIHGN